MSDLQVDVEMTRLDDATAIAAITGRLDSATVPTIADRMLSPVRRGQGVVYDLAGLNYLSAAGVRLIVAVVRRAEDSDARVAFARLPAEVAETLSVSGFAMFISTFNSRDEAVAHVRRGSA